MTKLDLNKLPNIENKIGVLRFDPLKEFPALKELGEISERIYGAANFNGAKPDENYPLYAEKSHFRAALSEFVSISEMVKLKSHDLRIDNLDLPLLHFFKELRVTNFHIKSFIPSIQSTNMTWPGVNYPDDRPYEFQYKFLTIDNCDLCLFKDNNNYNNFYKNDTFHSVINWVNEKQGILGITHVFEAALKQYCKLLDERTRKN